MTNIRDSIIIGVPYFEVSLRWSDGKKLNIYCDAYFSVYLKEKAVMLIVKKERENEKHFGNILIDKTLPFNLKNIYEYIDLHWQYYNLLIEELKNTVNRNKSRREPDFSKRFSFSENVRLIFGGLLTGPPTISLDESFEKKILAEFYEQTLFTNKEKPSIIRESKTIVPFIYLLDKKEIIFPSKEKSKFKYTARILTNFLRKQLVTIPI